MGGCCDRGLGRYVRRCQSSFHAWCQWAGDTAFTAVASVWGRGELGGRAAADGHGRPTPQTYRLHDGGRDRRSTCLWASPASGIGELRLAPVAVHWRRAGSDRGRSASVAATAASNSAGGADRAQLTGVSRLCRYRLVVRGPRHVSATQSCTAIRGGGRARHPTDRDDRRRLSAVASLLRNPPELPGSDLRRHVSRGQCAFRRRYRRARMSHRRSRSSGCTSHESSRPTSGELVCDLVDSFAKYLTEAPSRRAKSGSRALPGSENALATSGSSAVILPT